MANILVEMDEDAYLELNDIIRKAEKQERTLKYFNDTYIIIETAIRMKSELTLNEKEEICVDGVTLTHLIINMQGAINESGTTDVRQS